MIDILISLCLAFALFSGLVSGVVELLAQLCKMRGKVLYEGIALILGELPNESYSFYGKLKRIAGCTEKAITNQSNLTAKLFNNPLIDTLSQPGSKASYIGSTTFSAALIQELSGDGSWASLRQSLDDRSKPLGALFGPMLDEAAGDLNKFKLSVESHFNLVMDRVSGWYKRRSQAMMFLIGLLLAVILNVNAINIIQHFRTHPELVAQLAKYAEEKVNEVDQALSPAIKPQASALTEAAQGQPSAANRETSLAENQQADSDESEQSQGAKKELTDRINNIQKDINELKNLNLPILWNQNTIKEFNLSMIAGWLITALAATLGAPYWFDMISKLFAIRGTGKKPEEPANATSPINAPQVQINLPSSGAATIPAESAPLNDYEASCMNGEDIEALQKALGLPATQVNGKFSTELRAALRQWQITTGRIANGQFDESTVLAVLYPEA